MGSALRRWRRHSSNVVSGGEVVQIIFNIFRQRPSRNCFSPRRSDGVSVFWLECHCLGI